MLELLFPAVRFVHFAAAMQLFGTAIFVTALSTPATAGRLAAPLRRLLAASIVLLALSSVAWLMLQTGTMTGDLSDALAPAALQLVLLGTQFGHVWIAVLAIAAALLASLAIPRRFRSFAAAALSAAMLVALGLIGHLATEGGWLGLATRTSQAIHLLAAGFWLGSLLPLALCLKAAGHPGGLREAELALQRFSGLGHLAVALTLATGLFNTWVLLGAPPVDLADPYQALLATKIALVFAMIALALSNRYLLLPRLRQRADAIQAAARLQRSIAGELALGAAVVALVSLLGTLPR